MDEAFCLAESLLLPARFGVIFVIDACISRAIDVFQITNFQISGLHCLTSALWKYIFNRRMLSWFILSLNYVLFIYSHLFHTRVHIQTISLWRPSIQVYGCLLHKDSYCEDTTVRPWIIMLLSGIFTLERCTGLLHYYLRPTGTGLFFPRTIDTITPMICPLVCGTRRNSHIRPDRSKGRAQSNWTHVTYSMHTTAVTGIYAGYVLDAFQVALPHFNIDIFRVQDVGNAIIDSLKHVFVQWLYFSAISTMCAFPNMQLTKKCRAYFLSVNDKA